MKISSSLTDDAALTELGYRLALARLHQNLTQQQLASQAGLAKRTVERIEAGKPTVTTNLIRLLKALNLLSRLEALLPEATSSPMEQLKHRSKERQRASTTYKVAEGPTRKWTWGDER